LIKLCTVEDVEWLFSVLADPEVRDANTDDGQDAPLCLDAIYHCPHHPTEGAEPYVKDCDCRKPRPGMLLRGREDFDLDLSRSFLIGDRCGDLEAGRNAGCTTGLVLTGYGAKARGECERRSLADAVGKSIGDVWDTFKGIIQST